MGLTGAFTVRVTAQAPSDAAARAVIEAERALDGRTLARRTVAVLPFSIATTDTMLASLGYGLAEFLSDDLAHSHRLIMVERLRLADLQHEQGLSLTGSIDPETSVRVGHLIAAQHLIFGAINVSGPGTILIDSRAASVESGAVEMQHTVSTSTDAIFSAERELVMSTLSAFGITLTADEKRALYERVAPVFRAFVSFSRGVRAEQEGDDHIAVASFDEAASLDHNFRLAAARLAAARQRLASRVSASAVMAPAPNKDGAKARESAAEEGRDTREGAKDEPRSAATATTVPPGATENPGMPARGSAPSGELTSPATAKNGEAASAKKPLPPARHRAKPAPVKP